MDDNIFFQEVIKIVKETLSKELAFHSEYYNKDVILDTDKCYRVIIEWKKCMGEIVIEQPEFAPYRYVSFKIVSCIDTDSLSLFCWYDSSDDSLDSIRAKIDEGLKIGFNYSK